MSTDQPTKPTNTEKTLASPAFSSSGGIAPAQPGYQEFMPRFQAEMVRRFTPDGIAFDNTNCIRDSFSTDKTQIEYDRLRSEYPQATIDLLANVKRAIGPSKWVFFNGLYTNHPRKLSQQLRLLEVADGAAVEYFGYHPDPHYSETALKQEFNKQVLPIISAIPDQTDKAIMVFGRSRRYVYLDYEQDYRTQRYCLAAYLLGATPFSTFKYHSNFQTYPSWQGRTCGLATYEDYDLQLGNPTGRYVTRNGVYTRSFEKGLVALAPSALDDRQLSLDRIYFTPQGERREGTVRLQAGEGAILLTDCPPSPPARIVIDDFEDGQTGEWRFPVHDEQTRIIDESGSRFLRIRTSRDAIKPYHEKRLQPIRSLTKYTQLKFRIRTTDPSAAVLLRVEVDDTRPAPEIRTHDQDGKRNPPPFEEDTRRAFAALVLQPEGGTFRFKDVDCDIAYGQLRYFIHQIPFAAHTGPTWQTNGQWHEVTLDLPQAFAAVAPHLKPWRVANMRVISSADLDDVVLSN